MAQDQRVTGANPLSYVGVRALTPPNLSIIERDPRSGAGGDYRIFEVGSLWLNPVNQTLWCLVNKENNIPIWISIGVGPAGDLNFLRGNDGVLVAPDAAHAINVITAGATVQFINSALNSEVINFAISNLLLGTTGAITSGVQNVGYGQFSLASVTSGQQNTAIGYQVGANLTTGSFNTLIGRGSGSAYTSSQSSNILIANAGDIADANTIRIGNQGSGSGQQNRNFQAGIAGVVPPGTLNMVTVDLATGQLGSQAIPTGDITTVLTANATPQFVEVAGVATVDFNLSNLLIGVSGSSITTASANVSLGQNALQSITSGIGNTAIGRGALQNTTTANANMAIGAGALTNNTTGAINMAVGTSALNQNITGSNNAAIGVNAMLNMRNGSNNTAIGCNSMNQVAFISGSNNTSIGEGSGTAYTTTESSNICINSVGTLGESNTLHIGAATGTGTKELNAAFIHGIRGITTGVNDAIAVLIDSAGQLGTVSSSVRYKDNIKDLRGSEVIYNLRPRMFTFKQDGRSAWGLIAEEVYQEFPALAVLNENGMPETVKYHELPVLLLAEIQKLKAEIEILKGR